MAGRQIYNPGSIPIQPTGHVDKSWGKGIWIAEHLTAAWADTPEKAAFFCQQFRYICNNLPCPDCVKDALAYIAMNPPERAEDVFVWLWQFHNTVNVKLGKPVMPFAEARDLYYGGKIKQCDGGCGGEPHQRIPIERIRPNIRK